MDMEKIFNDIVKAYSTRMIDQSNIPILLTKLMETVEKLKHLSGIEKRQMVLDILMMIVEKSGLIKDGDKESVLFFIKTVAPLTIDLIISASNGHLKLGNKKSCCF